MHVRAPLDSRYSRSVVVALTSGVVISLTALTGGIAPAYAKPPTDPVVPTTTTVPAPEPPVVTGEQTMPTKAPPQEAPPSSEAPPSKVRVQAPPTVEAPPSQTEVPQTQAQAPQIQTQAPPSPVQTSTSAVVAPSTVATPTTAVNTPTTSAEPPAPRIAAPSSTESATSSAAAPATSSAQSPAILAPATVSASASESATLSASAVSPTAALVAPSSALIESPTSSPSAAATTSSRTPGGASSSSNVSQAAARIETPQTLQAPKEDVEIAKAANVVEVKPDPAPAQDVAAFASSIKLNTNLGGISAGATASADLRLNSDRTWDRPVRQWRPDWVQYDECYRPIILNPYHERVRIVYIYENAPRIVWIPPLARVVLEVAQFAAYSFTAVVETAAAVVNTAANVAVGSFFGGGYFPGVGMPLPPPPPPVWRYDNVPVQVRYSTGIYEPFRVRSIVDVGDDTQFGERKVLLDGATPAWGVWRQTPSGERQFEVHRTQQFPGLDDPREAPLPGDYQMRLVSDDKSSGLDRRDIYLIVAAAVVAGLGFGAIGMSIYLGRRRPQH